MRVPGTFFARYVVYSSFVRKAGCVMYGVIRLSVSSKHYPALFAYCSSMTALYKNLKNAALFIVRQWYTAYGKTDLQPLQKEVIQKVEDTCRSTGRKKPGRIISNRFIELLMRLTENPDYYARLPRHSAQYAIKEAVRQGCYVITCDYLPQNPGHKFSHEYHNVSTTDKEAVLSLARRLKVDGIVAYASDPAAPTAAYVCEKLGLPTSPYKSVEILSKKHLFRK